MKQTKSLDMKLKYSFLILTSLLWAQPSLALEEEVQTADGRTILLKDDGTYEIKWPKQRAWQSFLQERAPLFRKTKRNHSDTIDYMPNFANISGQDIVGIEFTTEFQNAFGKPILRLNGTVEERVSHRRTTTAGIFYTFKDNPYIDKQDYDKLLPLAVQKTGRQVLSITAIAFADGEVKRFPGEQRSNAMPLTGYVPNSRTPPPPSTYNEGYSEHPYYALKSRSEAIQLTRQSEVKTSDLLPTIRNGSKAQMKKLKKRYKGGKIQWIGWVTDKKQKSSGQQEIWVDLDEPGSGFSVYDVEFKIDLETASRLREDEYIFYTGTIKSIKRLFGSPIIKLTDVEVIPMAALEP